MGHYVDGFVVPVPQKSLAAYRAMAKNAERSGSSMERCTTPNVSPMT